MGYCLFNNVALGAAYARQALGVRRVLIVDWDVHHGNGTQHAFENTPEVLFFSVHQHPHFPGTGLFFRRLPDATADVTDEFAAYLAIHP